jgi:hypothetical protein
MRVADSFDYLKTHQDDLTSSQAELVKGLRKSHHDYGLSEKQTQLLFDLVKYLRPDDTEITVRQKY